jgi:hypothetical protein
MSTFSNTARPGLAARLQLPSSLVALVLSLALAGAVLTVVLVGSGGSGSAAPHAAAQRLHLGGPGEGAPGMRSAARNGSPPALANDGSQHFGARP